MQTSHSTERVDLSVMETALDFITDWDEFQAHLELTSFGLDAGQLGDSPTSVADSFDTLNDFKFTYSSTAEGASEDQPIPVPSSAHPKPIKRKRQTPKQEIDKLRLLEHNLTRRLETLQQKSRLQTTSGDIHRDKILFWKNLATHQYQQRLESEQENQRLKKLIAKRIKHAKRLKKSVLQSIHN